MENPTVQELVEQLICDNRVMIFSKTFCPYCKKVKDKFDEHDIPYYELELDAIADGHEVQAILLEKTGQRTVPNVFISGCHVGGCDVLLQHFADASVFDMLEGVFATYDYDLIVIGGGSGGLSASKEAAANGRRVVVCDFVKPSPVGTKWGLGGTCVNVGCIPKLLMHKAGLIGDDIKYAHAFGWSVPLESVSHDWNTMVSNVQDYIKSLNWGYKKMLMSNQVQYLNAQARFIDAHTITVMDAKGSSKELSAQNFIVAVGGRPNYPDIPGALEYGITSDDIFSLPHPPNKTLLIGASYIAVEVAGFLSLLGYPCTIMVRSVLLRSFDQQMAKMIRDDMAKVHGVKFVYDCSPVRIEPSPDRPESVVQDEPESPEMRSEEQSSAAEGDIRLSLATQAKSFVSVNCARYPRNSTASVKRASSARARASSARASVASAKSRVSSDENEENIPIPLYRVTGCYNDGTEYQDDFNTVIFAVGRIMSTPDLNIENIGVKLNPANGKILVNRYEQTSVHNIFSVGDIIDGKPELTPVAIQTGKLVARRLYARSSVLMDYQFVPTTIFSPVEYGCVGMAEEHAIITYGEPNIEVYHASYSPLEWTLPARATEGCYAKLICLKPENERIIGLHFFGPNAGEVVQGFALSVKMGATKDDFDALIAIHPTNAENLLYAPLKPPQLHTAKYIRSFSTAVAKRPTVEYECENVG